MATMELVVLSSSPPRLPSDLVATPPSAQCGQSTISSDLPSLSSLIKSNNANVNGLRTGSRAAAIPEGAIVSFESACNLLKAKQLSVDIYEQYNLEPSSGVKKAIKQATKRSQARVVEKEPVEKKEKPRKPRTSKPKVYKVLEKEQSTLAVAKQEEDEVDGPKAPAKVRKLRTKKMKDESQTKLKKGKVTKPGKDNETKNKQKSALKEVSEAKRKESKSTGTTSSHFAQTVTVGGEQVVVENLKLDKAIRRRTDWTPVKDTQKTLEDDSPSLTQVCHEIGQKITPKLGFGDVLADFSFQNVTVEAPVLPREASGEAVTKRRKIELLPTVTPAASNEILKKSAATEGPTEKRAKPPKKKPVTITDRVTAQYRTPVGEAGTLEPAPVRKSFPPRSVASSAGAGEADKVQYTNLKERARNKSPRKRAETDRGQKTKKSTVKKKLAQSRLKLLSPESAVSRFPDQDILFGTSSQLAGGESPTFLRDLQQAMRESESIAFPQEDDAQVTLRSTKLSDIQAKRHLWSAATRDFDDSLLAPERVQPRPQQQLDSPNEEGVFVNIESYDDIVHDQNIADKPTTIGTSAVDDVTVSEQSCVPEHEGFPEQPLEDASFIDIESYAEERYAANVERRGTPTLSISSDSDTSIPPPKAPISPSTVLESFRTAKLARDNALSNPRSPLHSSVPDRLPLQRLPSNIKLAKPQTSRKMSTLPQGLLPAPSSLIVSEAPGAESQSIPAKRRGRPPKEPNAPPKPRKRATSAKSFIPRKLKIKDPGDVDAEGWKHIDEIEDSQDEATPSPPPRRKRGTASSEPTLELVTGAPASRRANGAATAAAKACWDTIKGTLFPLITRTVKGEPRSSGEGSKEGRGWSWWERMLVFDPIVVEELTGWLVGKGIKVKMQVKKKKTKKKMGNGKGKGKKVDEEGSEGDWVNGEEEMEEIELNVQGWMVQKWCEENSICCFWKENLRLGKRKQQE